MGLNTGVSLNLKNIGPVALVPEVYYVEKGTRFTDQLRNIQNMNPNQPVFNEPFDLQFNLAYFEVPVLIKVNLPFLSTERIFTYIAEGPVFCMAVGLQFFNLKRYTIISGELYKR